MKEKILLSACLLGKACRYDGRSVPCDKALLLEEKYDIIPICPEVEGGLPTPRIPSERIGERVMNKAGEDVTENYLVGAQAALGICKSQNVRLAVLKERSPSCGCREIYDGSFSGRLVSGVGVTVELLKSHGVEVLGESEIDKLLK